MSTGLESLNILLADDNPNARAIVVTLLNSFGVRNVLEVCDGAEAVEMLRRWPADLALIDFKMQPLDGAELTRLVRNSPDSRDPYLPIIMMTGYTAKRRVVEARDAGVNEILVKPVRARALLDRIYAVILKPRSFVRTATYFGPCRRRRDDPNHPGPWRREGEPGARGRTLEETDLDDDLVWAPKSA